MSIKTPNLGLNGNIEPCSENAIEKINENIDILDNLNSISVERVASLPLTASPGDQVLVDGDNTLYYWTDSWQSITPLVGMFGYDETNSSSIVFNGTDWIEISPDVIDATTASNLGTGEGVFYQKNGDDLEFKSLVAGQGIVLSSDADEITLETLDAAGEPIIFQGDIDSTNEGRFVLAGTEPSQSFDFFIAGSTSTYGDLTNSLYTVAATQMTPIYEKIRIKVIGYRSSTITNFIFPTTRLNYDTFGGFPNGSRIFNENAKTELTVYSSTSVFNFVLTSKSPASAPDPGTSSGDPLYTIEDEVIIELPIIDIDPSTPNTDSFGFGIEVPVTWYSVVGDALFQSGFLTSTVPLDLQSKIIVTEYVD